MNLLTETFDLDEMIKAVPATKEKLQFVMLFSILKGRNTNSDFLKDLNVMLGE